MIRWYKRSPFTNSSFNEIGYFPLARYLDHELVHLESQSSDKGLKFFSQLTLQVHPVHDFQFKNSALKSISNEVPEFNEEYTIHTALNSKKLDQLKTAEGMNTEKDRITKLPVIPRSTSMYEKFTAWIIRFLSHLKRLVRRRSTVSESYSFEQKIHRKPDGGSMESSRLPRDAGYWVEDARAGEADARIGPESVESGLPDQLLQVLHEEVKAPDRWHVERQRHRRESYREE